MKMSGVEPYISPAIGPALIISVGYIDLGKWVAAIEGGAHFGFEHLLALVFFNCTAALCHYLAISIAVATRKNLAQICSEEYCKLTSVLLGVEIELSMIVSDLSSILGIAHGLNLLLGLDLFLCIFFAAAVAVIFPFFVTVLDNYNLEMLYVCVSGFTCLFYMFGMLGSQPELSNVIYDKYSRLNRESACSLMALLGANIMPYNFYIHSSIVQQQRPPNVNVVALIHDHFFAILSNFAGIFLVNYILMNSATAVFDNAGLLMPTSEDALMLMDQILRSPVTPVPFFLVLFFSSLINALSWNLGGQVILHDFFGNGPPIWVHRILIKALAIIPALYFIQSAGAEGIYQLLLFCQVISAMLLPSSVIPLFRAASSRTIMGAFKISWHLEVLALSAFFGILTTNIVFTSEMLFGSSSWIVDLRGNMGSGVTLPYLVLLLIAFTSLGLTLYLVVTPLESASDGPDMQIWTQDLQKDLHELSEGREENELNKTEHDEDWESAEEQAPENSLESQSDNPVMKFSFDLPETIIDSDHSVHKFSIGLTLTASDASQASHPEEIESEVDMGSMGIADEISAGSLVEEGILQTDEPKDSIERSVGVEGEVLPQKDDEQRVSLELLETSSTSKSEIPGSSKNARGRDDNASNVNGKGAMSGLTRAARRQLAAVLDEFWGHLFDFHGQLTQEAKSRRLDVLLGLDAETTKSVQAEFTESESLKQSFPKVEKGLVFPKTSRDYNAPIQQSIPTADSSYGMPMGTPSWSPNTQLVDACLQNSCSKLLEQNETSYSTLPLQHYSGSQVCQPTTIYGNEIRSYKTSIDSSRNTDSSTISLDQPQSRKFFASSFTDYKDQLTYAQQQNRLRTLCTYDCENPVSSPFSRLQLECLYYESSSIGFSSASSYTKKYHSVPDISELADSSRNLSLNDRTVQLTDPFCPYVSGDRLVYEQSQYSNPVSRAEEVPLAFDELSESKRFRNDFARPISLSLDSESLWARRPFELFFTKASKGRSGEDGGVADKLGTPKVSFYYSESESLILQSLRCCIVKLLNLEGSNWLLTQNGGYDEKLIDQLAARERFLQKEDTGDVNQRTEEADQASFLSLAPKCGDGCIWQARLVTSFGVWCIQRILELLLLEVRPELWGKYTYVLNRLQGILDPAFSKPRTPLLPCECLEVPGTTKEKSNLLQQSELQQAKRKPVGGQCTTTSMILDLIKDVEAAISGRKGRTGTAAGDVAFPKGKENLTSVLKRYKRRLLNKSSGTNARGSSSSRKVRSHGLSFAR